MNKDGIFYWQPFCDQEENQPEKLTDTVASEERDDSPTSELPSTQMAGQLEYHFPLVTVIGPEKGKNHPNKIQELSARTTFERRILSTHFAKLLEYEMELPTTILLPPGENLRRKQSRGKRARVLKREGEH